MWSPTTAKGTLFADTERLALWLELLDRCGQEVVQTGVLPDLWLALPIDASTSELLWRYETQQGWRTPEEAAYAALAFAPPRQQTSDDQLSDWYWSDAPCTTTTPSGSRTRTSKPRKTSQALFGS